MSKSFIDGIQFMENQLHEQEAQSKDIQLKLLKGELEWEDEKVQFFIPVALRFTDFEWLKLIAEHNCIEEDEKIIKNFLDMAESIMEINSNQLIGTVMEKMRKRFE